MKRFTFLPVIAVAFAAACQDGPTAPQTTITPKAEIIYQDPHLPLSMSVFVPCAGEIVQISGEIHDSFIYTVNGNNFMWKWHDNPQGVVGLGMTSGDKYQAIGASQGRLQDSFVNGRFEYTYTNTFRLISQGTGNTFLIHTTQHVTMTPYNGPTADLLNSTVECGENREWSRP